MKSQFAIGAAVAALSLAASLSAPGAANALTYTSVLEYSSNTYGPSGSFGTVTIEEVDANNVKVTVDLDDSIRWFVDTDSSHDAFSFNISDSPESVVTILDPADGGDFEYRNRSWTDTPNRDNDPYGDFANAFALDDRHDHEPGSLVFNVYNANGITFAGVGAAFDSDGRLISLGTGNRFFSNSNGTASGFTGGWWFAAQVVGYPASGGHQDIGGLGGTLNTFGGSSGGCGSHITLNGGSYGGGGGCGCDSHVTLNGGGGSGHGGGGCDKPQPFTIAARDAFTTTSVPEPATWALMILGFGGAGVMLRRRGAIAA